MVVVGSGSNFFQYVTNRVTIQKLETIIADNEKEITSQAETIGEMEEDIKEKETTIKNQKTKIDNLTNEVNLLTEENQGHFRNELYLAFYEKHAAIVPDDGKNVYHLYGCDELGDYSFWIYNTEAAEGRGYYPCANCH